MTKATTKIDVVTIDHRTDLFSDGGALEGFQPGDMTDHESERARALYAALDLPTDSEEETVGRLPDGRWALVGRTVTGHEYAVECAAEDEACSHPVMGHPTSAEAGECQECGAVCACPGDGDTEGCPIHGEAS